MNSNLFSRPTFHPPRLAPDANRAFAPAINWKRPIFNTARRKPMPPASAAVTVVRNYLSSPPVLPDV